MHRLTSSPRPPGTPPLRVADVGTGAGTIAVSLAVTLRRRGAGSDVEIFAADVLRGRARARQGERGGPRRGRRDARSPSPTSCRPSSPTPFDVLLANLPYVRSEVVPTLPVAASFEPEVALDGGADGLALIARLLVRLPEVMAPRRRRALRDRLRPGRRDGGARRARAARLDVPRRTRPGRSSAGGDRRPLARGLMPGAGLPDPTPRPRHRRNAGRREPGPPRPDDGGGPRCRRERRVRVARDRADGDERPRLCRAPRSHRADRRGAGRRHPRDGPGRGCGARDGCSSTRRSRPTSRGRRVIWSRERAGLDPHLNHLERLVIRADDPRADDYSAFLGVRAVLAPDLPPGSAEAGHEGHRGRRRTAPRRRARPRHGGVRRPGEPTVSHAALPRVRGAGRDEGARHPLAGPPGRRPAVAGHGDRRPVRRPRDDRGGWPRRGDGRRPGPVPGAARYMAPSLADEGAAQMIEQLVLHARPAAGGLEWTSAMTARVVADDEAGRAEADRRAARRRPRRACPTDTVYGIGVALDAPRGHRAAVRGEGPTARQARSCCCSRSPTRRADVGSRRSGARPGGRGLAGRADARAAAAPRRGTCRASPHRRGVDDRRPRSRPPGAPRARVGRRPDAGDVGERVRRADRPHGRGDRRGARRRGRPHSRRWAGARRAAVDRRGLLGSRPRLLREGAIPAAALAAVLDDAELPHDLLRP